MMIMCRILHRHVDHSRLSAFGQGRFVMYGLILHDRVEGEVLLRRLVDVCGRPLFVRH